MSASLHDVSPIHFHDSCPTKAGAEPPIVGGRVELQLLTTLKCNLKCTYCSLGVGDVLGSQTELDYEVDQLANFIDTHLAGKDVYVTFYGGEPTLNMKLSMFGSFRSTSEIIF